MLKGLKFLLYALEKFVFVGNRIQKFRNYNFVGFTFFYIISNLLQIIYKRLLIKNAFMVAVEE